MSARAVALEAVLAVIGAGKSLKEVLNQLENTPRYRQLSHRDQSFARTLTLNQLRWQPQLNWYSQTLLKKPFTAGNLDVGLCLEQALVQILVLDVAEHAALNCALELIQKRRKSWAKAPVNAVLRRVIKERAALASLCQHNPSAFYALPEWLLNHLKEDWQHHWQAIAQSYLKPAPIFIRLSPQIALEAYLKQLAADDLPAAYTPSLHVNRHDIGRRAVAFEQIAISALPLLSTGEVNVQDLAAQLCAPILNPQNQDHILDACAAPGGKTIHLKELAPNARVTAVDISAARLQKTAVNLQRCQQQADLICADITADAALFAPHSFDKILLDAPCSATGIIRRQPDIKVHRQPEDIEKLLPIQQLALQNCWQWLRPGGRLLYCTCSVLKCENHGQIALFLRQNPNARLIPIDIEFAENSDIGSQLLPANPSGSDGFFYALLEKIR